MTIFTDPLRWSKAAVGSEWGPGLLIGTHLVLGGVTGVALYKFDLAFLMIPILIIGMILPFMYLYALRKLLHLIQSKDQKSMS
jgi:hypothetical protein